MKKARWISHNAHYSYFYAFSKRSIFLLWLWFPPSIPFVGKLRQKSFCQCRGKYLWGTEQIQLFFIWKYTRQLPKQFTFLSIFIFSIRSGHVRVREGGSNDPFNQKILNAYNFFLPNAATLRFGGEQCACKELLKKHENQMVWTREH